MGLYIAPPPQLQEFSTLSKFLIVMHFEPEFPVRTLRLISAARLKYQSSLKFSLYDYSEKELLNQGQRQ